MALTKVTSAIIKNATITGEDIASETVTHTHTDSSIVKIVTLTQAQYDALSSYDASTVYITT
jgi:hypothetical protein